MSYVSTNHGNKMIVKMIDYNRDTSQKGGLFKLESENTSTDQIKLLTITIGKLAIKIYNHSPQLKIIQEEKSKHVMYFELSFGDHKSGFCPIEEEEDNFVKNHYEQSQSQY